MRVGVFDSGLGGLVILRGLLSNKVLSKYDFVYLGDTKNLPYGNKSQKQIFKLTKNAVDYLFEQDCELVIIACNTSSSQSLRKIQQEYLPKSKFRNRKVLGIIRPTIESAARFKNIALIGTLRTIDSRAYYQELKDVNSKAKLSATATPLLVPMIEAGNLSKINEVLEHYLAHEKNPDALILGCTHYGLLKNRIRKIVGDRVKVIAQEDILPAKLEGYLKRHREIERKLSKNAKIKLEITKINPLYLKLARQWFGKTKLELVKY